MHTRCGTRYHHGPVSHIYRAPGTAKPQPWCRNCGRLLTATQVAAHARVRVQVNLLLADVETGVPAPTSRRRHVKG